MNVAKPLAAGCALLALVATSSALAAPSGSEYLPQVPKSPSHSSKGSSSHGSSTKGSSGSQGSATGGSSGSTSSVVEPSTSGSPGDTGASTAKQHPATKDRVQQPKPPDVKIAPVKVAGASPDTAGGSVLLPIALLVGGGALILLAGMALRRNYGKFLNED